MKSPLAFAAVTAASAAVAAAALSFSGPAAAQEVGQHPAVFAPRQLPGIDASTFVVGHPASPTWAPHVHANFDHPALAQARLAANPVVDANTFLVQPPAATVWVAAPRTVDALATARRVDLVMN